MKKTKVIVAIAALFCLAQIVPLASVQALTVCPNGNCSIMIEEVALKADNQTVIDNDDMSLMTNVPFEKVFLPGTQVEISIKASGPIQDVAYWSFYWGTNDTPTLINSDRTICLKCKGTGSTAAGEIVAKVNWTVPADAKKYSKIWIQSFDASGKPMGGANTRPLVHSYAVIKPLCYVYETKDITENGATATVHFVNSGNVFPLNIWLELRKDGESYAPNHEKPIGFVTFKTIADFSANGQAFNFQLTELKPNVKYWVRAIAASEGGFCESREMDFTTLCALPQIKTLRCSKIDWTQNDWNKADNQAWLTCSIESFGEDNYMEIMVQGFNINDPQERFGTSWQRIECSQFAQFPSEFTLQAGKGFSAEEIYDFEFLARNSRKEISSGGHKYFPPPLPGYKPVIETGGCIKKGDGWADLTIDVISISNKTKIWFEVADQMTGIPWGENQATPDPNGKSFISEFLEVELPGRYTIRVKNLASNRGVPEPPTRIKADYPNIQKTPYYVYRAHAQDIVTGSQDTGSSWLRLQTYFTTQLPISLAKPAKNITYNSAELGVYIDFPGFSSECIAFFKYWPKSAKGEAKNKATKESFPRMRIETKYYYSDFYIIGSSYAAVTDLQPDTIYCFQAYVINGLGQEVPSKNTLEFRTLPKSIYSLPIIQTTGVSQVGPNTFCMQGKLLDFGGWDWVEVKIDYWGMDTHFEGSPSTIYVATYRKDAWKNSYPELSVFRSNLVFGKSFLFRFTARTSGGITYGFLIDSNGKKVEGGYWKFQTDPLPGEQFKPEIYFKSIKVIMPDPRDEDPKPKAILTINVEHMGKPTMPWIDLTYLWTPVRSGVIAGWPNTWNGKSQKVRIDHAGEYSYLLETDLDFGRMYFFSVNAENGKMLTWMVPDNQTSPHTFTINEMPPAVELAKPTFIEKETALANVDVVCPGSWRDGEFTSWFEVATFRGTINELTQEISISLADKHNKDNQPEKIISMTPLVLRFKNKSYSHSIIADKRLTTLPDEKEGDKITTTFFAYRAWVQNFGGKSCTRWTVLVNGNYLRMDKMPWENP